MNWKDLGEAIAKIGLPLLGAVLPIPGGAAFGTALASAIGSPSAKPEDILNLLTQNADAVQKAKQFEDQHQEKMLDLQLNYELQERKADSADIASVNSAIVAEANASAHENWWQTGWRPFNGYVVGLASLVTTAGVLWLAYLAIFHHDAASLNAIPVIVNAVAVVLAIPGAAVGITAWHRGVMQREQVKSKGAS